MSKNFLISFVLVLLALNIGLRAGSWLSPSKTKVVRVKEKSKPQIQVVRIPVEAKPAKCEPQRTVASIGRSLHKRKKLQEKVSEDLKALPSPTEVQPPAAAVPPSTPVVTPSLTPAPVPAKTATPPQVTAPVSPKVEPLKPTPALEKPRMAVFPEGKPVTANLAPPVITREPSSVRTEPQDAVATPGLMAPKIRSIQTED